MVAERQFIRALLHESQELVEKIGDVV